MAVRLTLEARVSLSPDSPTEMSTREGTIDQHPFPFLTIPSPILVAASPVISPTSLHPSPTPTNAPSRLSVDLEFQFFVYASSAVCKAAY